MFTECPECSTAFRVTAKVLAQAGGRVRCGGCGNSFSALEHLTEELPATNEQDGTSPSEEDKFRETSRQLLKTLDDLAGPEDVVIEDTGIEWRVLDEDDEEVAPTEDTGKSEESDEEQTDLAVSEEEDWTELELLDEDAEDSAAADDVPLEVEEELAAIHNELSAKDDPDPVNLDAQLELQVEAMGIDITGSQEVADEETVTADAEEDDQTGAGPLDEDEDPTGAGPLDEDEDPTGAGPLDEDEDEYRESNGEFEEHTDVAAKALEDGEEEEELSTDAALAAVQERGLDEMIHLALPESAGDEAEEPEHSAHDELPEQSEEEMTINQQIDQELMAAAAQDQDLKATIIGLGDPTDVFDEDSPDVETIIMEGDVVRGAMEREREKEKRERALARFDNVGNLIDTYAANRAVRGGRRSTDPAGYGYGMIAGSALLALLLAVQVMHAYREELSTYELFNQTFGPIYRMLGNPVTPEWDIKGWQFESTNGSVAEGEDVLTIFSRIGNRSEQPLPYPLVHVSLTDRWEEIIGSRVLEPSEYLVGNLDPSRPVVPGDNFTAVITVDEPSVDATGFKVNVCYRVSPGRVRCATEDFKD